ncbi:MAG: protein translocase subunit SecF [Syntrophales bacterium]|jgi:preprotein translocase subunit SecF
MELVKPGININFVGRLKYAVIFSVVLTIICIISIAWRGLNYGIDFAGGTLVQIKFHKAVSADDIRKVLIQIGIDDSVIQTSGADEVIIRTAKSSSEIKGLSAKIEESLNATYGKDAFQVQRVEVVGPKVGKDLTQKAILAVIFSWVGMLIYIAIRFEFRHAVGGIVGVIHDVTIVVGIFSIFAIEFTLTIVAALLTIIGYSIHDTIVVFDRVRENVRKNTRKDLPTVMNESINQTLSRTILTSFTVALVVAVLYIFGGAVIHDFAFALLVGVIFGTYSSVFIAAPVVLEWERYSPSTLKKRK